MTLRGPRGSGGDEAGPPRTMGGPELAVSYLRQFDAGAQSTEVVSVYWPLPGDFAAVAVHPRRALPRYRATSRYASKYAYISASTKALLLRDFFIRGI